MPVGRMFSVARENIMLAKLNELLERIENGEDPRVIAAEIGVLLKNARSAVMNDAQSMGEVNALMRDIRALSTMRARIAQKLSEAEGRTVRPSDL